MSIPPWDPATAKYWELLRQVIALTYLLLLIENELWDVTSFSISLVAHTCIILSYLLPVMKYYESSVTAIQFTGLLCS